MNRLIRAALVAGTITSLALPAVAREPAAEQTPLTLEQAVSLGRADQPRLEAYDRDAQASEDAAVAARSLPDLQLIGGIQNFPITGDTAFSPTDDFMTKYTIGVMREQVRRSKREAEASRILAEALVSRRQASSEERDIRRSVMLAWIDAVEARAKQKLLAQMIADLKTGRNVMKAAIPTGGSTPALALQADAEIALEQAQLEDAKRAESRARAELARWIGSPAYAPLPETLPTIEVPLDIVPSVDAHPEVQVALAQQESAQRQVTVAREGLNPDISWSVTLGLRPKFGQMISGTVSIPLQINRGNRQDRQIAEAQARAGAAELRAEDKKRELRSNYQAAVADYEGARAELKRIDLEAVPALESAFKAAEARYEGGGGGSAGGTLDEPFRIVRRYIEAGIQSVSARGREAQAAAQILYILGETGR